MYVLWPAKMRLPRWMRCTQHMLISEKGSVNLGGQYLTMSCAKPTALARSASSAVYTLGSSLRTEIGCAIIENTVSFAPDRANARWCSGSTGDFESPSPGSNPGRAANKRGTKPSPGGDLRGLMGSISLTNFSTAKLVRDSFPITKEES